MNGGGAGISDVAFKKWNINDYNWIVCIRAVRLNILWAKLQRTYFAAINLPPVSYKNSLHVHGVRQNSRKTMFDPERKPHIKIINEESGLIKKCYGCVSS